MRIVPLSITAIATIALVYVLNTKIGSAPPFGNFLSPQHGFWQNAEATEKDYNDDLKFSELSGNSSVYIDDRLVPHVFADNEHDVYFIQGYLHAKFRLWQMEFQTHAAAGRLCEILGNEPAVLKNDRKMRRQGLVWAAEKSLDTMMSDDVLKESVTAYTDGVNAYIKSLTKSNLPLEYKLLNYEPELWQPIKTAIFLKYMSNDLAGFASDFEYTNAKNYFGVELFEKLYPYMRDTLDPIVPKGTPVGIPAVQLKIPSTVDSLYYNFKDTVKYQHQNPDPNNGSNNWAVGGSKTKTGAPILCNDPHLGLNLPSLWFEMQLSTPVFNAYGATFPGSPSVIIGFNDSCAFGFTNAQRDVMDFYSIKFKDDSRKEYFFNGEWKTTQWRIETIKRKGSNDFIDSIAYIPEFGPVMYDPKFSGSIKENRNYALRWKAHDAGKELKLFNRLNHAKNYNDYLLALQYLKTPAQNCIFACKNGDIAIWHNGEFPAKWKRQGDFIMPGTDSSYMWQAMIPREENPHQYNPERGFVSSANQLAIDPAVYPYYIGDQGISFRGITINRLLSSMNQITVEDMEKLQTNNYNVYGAMAVPVLLKNLNENNLNSDEKKYVDVLKNWNHYNDTNSVGATVFLNWWRNLYLNVFDDEFKTKDSLILMRPNNEFFIEAILRDSLFPFIDNINTPVKESMKDLVEQSLKQTIDTLKKLEATGNLSLAKYKQTRITHLTQIIKPLSFWNVPIGGGLNVINATSTKHGPSWRMIVSLEKETIAKGIYPGGQSGNPGSKYYDNFIMDWAYGKYYTLWVMKKDDIKNKNIRWVMNFSKA